MKNHKMLLYSYWLSVICLIHCISFPLLIAFLPFLNVAFEINHWLEVGILLSVFIFGSYSLIHACITHHKNYFPLVMFYIGVALAVFVHFFYHKHTIDTGQDYLSFGLEILSGVIMAGAQFYNLKITPRACSH
jgi:hypothetical protein